MFHGMFLAAALLAIQEPSFKLSPDALDLPSGDRAWVIRATRDGGFAGTTIELTVTSDGALNCISSDRLRCPPSLDSATLGSIAAFVTRGSISDGRSSLERSCNDCFRYRITVRRRETNGRERTYFGYWDDVTENKGSPQLTEIARRIFAIK